MIMKRARACSFSARNLTQQPPASYSETPSGDLTKNESRILIALLEKRGAIVSREELMLKLWDSDEFVDDNTLTVNVNRPA